MGPVSGALSSSLRNYKTTIIMLTCGGCDNNCKVGSIYMSWESGTDHNRYADVVMDSMYQMYGS